MSLITDRDVRCYRDLGRLHIVIEQFLGKELWESYTTYSDSEARCYKLHLLIEARCYKLHIVIERLVVTSSLLQATYSDREAGSLLQATYSDRGSLLQVTYCDR